VLKLSPHEQKQLLKAVKGKNTISAKEFREALYGKTKPREVQKKRTKTEYAFIGEFLKHTHDTYEFILKGRHLSVNSINSLHFKEKLRYKMAVKKAVYDAGLVVKKILPKSTYCLLSPTAYNPKSRDDDGNSLTLKYIRDAITNLGFARDDSREYLEQKKCDEVLTKEWKISILIKISNKEIPNHGYIN